MTNWCGSGILTSGVILVDQRKESHLTQTALMPELPEPQENETVVQHPTITRWVSHALGGKHPHKPREKHQEQKAQATLKGELILPNTHEGFA